MDYLHGPLKIFWGKQILGTLNEEILSINMIRIKELMYFCTCYVTIVRVVILCYDCEWLCNSTLYSLECYPYI